MRKLTRHRESLLRKKGDQNWEVLAHLLQKSIKVPEKLRTNCTKKQFAWMPSRDDHILNDMLDFLEVLEEEVRNLEVRQEERYGGDEKKELMRMVSSICLVIAAVIKAEIGDVTRFSSSKDLAAYVGLTPITYQSGEKEWSGHTRNGSNRIKHVLIEATLFHFQHCPASGISQYYRKKKDAIGNKKAIVAGGRKLMEAIYFMLVRKQAFHAH